MLEINQGNGRLSDTPMIRTVKGGPGKEERVWVTTG